MAIIQTCKKNTASGSVPGAWTGSRFSRRSFLIQEINLSGGELVGAGIQGMAGIQQGFQVLQAQITLHCMIGSGDADRSGRIPLGVEDRSGNAGDAQRVLLLIHGIAPPAGQRKLLHQSFRRCDGVLRVTGKAVFADDPADGLLRQKGHHRFAAAGVVHGMETSAGGIGENPLVLMDDIQIEDSPVDMGGEIDCFSGSLLQVLQHRVSGPYGGHGGLNAVVEMHDVIAQAVVHRGGRARHHAV